MLMPCWRNYSCKVYLPHKNHDSSRFLIVDCYRLVPNAILCMVVSITRMRNQWTWRISVLNSSTASTTTDQNWQEEGQTSGNNAEVKGIPKHVPGELRGHYDATNHTEQACDGNQGKEASSNSRAASPAIVVFRLAANPTTTTKQRHKQNCKWRCMKPQSTHIEFVSAVCVFASIVFTSGTTAVD